MEIRLTSARLRPWTPADVESLAEHANNWNVARNMRDLFPYPYTPDDARSWLERVVGRVPVTNFAIEVQGTAAGGIGVRQREDVSRRTAEIGYWLGQRYWGRGIASEAVRAIVSHSFDSFDLVRLEAFVWEWNGASMRVLEKTGFTREGVLRSSVTKEGVTIDSMLYSLLRGESGATH